MCSTLLILLKIGALLFQLRPYGGWRRRWRLRPRRSLMKSRRSRHVLLRRPDHHPRVGLCLDVDNVAFRPGARVSFRLLDIRHLTRLLRRPRGLLLAAFGAVQRYRGRPATHAWASLQVRSCRVASALARCGQRIAIVPTHLYYTDLLFVHGVDMSSFQR